MQDKERLEVLRKIFAREIRKMQDEGVIKPKGDCGATDKSKDPTKEGSGVSI